MAAFALAAIEARRRPGRGPRVETPAEIRVKTRVKKGSEWGPVALPVFKTGRRLLARAG